MVNGFLATTYSLFSLSLPCVLPLPKLDLMFRSAASATKETMSLDHWRCVFRCTATSVFEILENAIRVAAADRPDEFVARRDRIVEALYTCRLRQQCSDHDRAADELHESSSGAAAATTRTDGTDAVAEVPGYICVSGFRFLDRVFWLTRSFG